MVSKEQVNLPKNASITYRHMLNMVTKERKCVWSEHKFSLLYCAVLVVLGVVLASTATTLQAIVTGSHWSSYNVNNFNFTF